MYGALSSLAPKKPLALTVKIALVDVKDLCVWVNMGDHLYQHAARSFVSGAEAAWHRAVVKAIDLRIAMSIDAINTRL